MSSEALSLGLFASSALLGMLIAATRSAAHIETPHSAHKMSKRVTRPSKGSFLLNVSKAPSAAAEAALAAAKAAGQAAVEGQNAELGAELIAKREKSMGPNVSVFYKQDGGLVVPSGKGSHMRDIDGNLYLDCCNNVACVGHAHPRVVEAGQRELGNIQTNGRFLNPIQQRYVEKLLATFPPELDTVYFVNSGSEANDLALRMAHYANKAARPNDIAILDSAYHGHTQALLDISPYKWYQAVDGIDYQPATTHVLELPDSFRGKYRGGQTEEVGALYAAELETLVGGQEGGVGVFIAESIVGCGGQVVPPPGYLRRCYEAVRKAGGVCIGKCSYPNRPNPNPDPHPPSASNPDPDPDPNLCPDPQPNPDSDPNPHLHPHP
jgi:hypothetical protein